jgi:hypothetical protein
MRESRTYGSGRGACDETHVPTATGFLLRCMSPVDRASLPASEPEAPVRPRGYSQQPDLSGIRPGESGMA